LSCGRDISASVLRDKIQISSIASSSYKELKNEEALAKDTMSVLSYCELALYGISENLQHSNMELPEETTQLCSSLHVGLRQAIALSCKASANTVLKRRDSIITEAKSVIRLPQLTGALRSAPLGESFLFQDSLEEAIKVQMTLDPIPTKRVSWPRENAPRNVGSGGWSKGDKRGHIRRLSLRGTLTKPLPPPLFRLKVGKRVGGNRK
jgi:hypothetical protein